MKRGGYSRGSKLSEYVKKKPTKRKPTHWDEFSTKGAMYSDRTMYKDKEREQ